MPERLAHPLAGDPRIRVPVELPDKLPAVTVPELQRDDMVGEFEDVEGVPAEVVTPADETPFHLSVATVKTLATWRIGLSAPFEVSMMLGSSENGSANPPPGSLPIVIPRIDIASVTTRIACVSSCEKRRCPVTGSASSFPNALL